MDQFIILLTPEHSSAVPCVKWKDELDRDFELQIGRSSSAGWATWQDGKGSCLRLSVHAKPKVGSAVSGNGNKDSRHAEVQRQNAQSSLEEKKENILQLLCARHLITDWLHVHRLALFFLSSLLAFLHWYCLHKNWTSCLVFSGRPKSRKDSNWICQVWLIVLQNQVIMTPFF